MNGKQFTMEVFKYMDFITLGFLAATSIPLYVMADSIREMFVDGSPSSDETIDATIKDTEILLGANKNYPSRAITIDMREFPSLSITGITKSGKTKMAEYILNKTKMAKVLINAYEDDFTSVKAKRITDIKEIGKYLDYLLEVKKFDKPVLVVIDETLSLLSYKEISKKLHLLLTKNGHKNLFIICLFQELNKYNCSFKTLFSSRVAMRSIQTSDIISSLGTSLEEYPRLKNREFILLSDNIYFGKTFDI